jgi:L-lactate dehydrogenase (cytochrome)
MTPHTRPRRLSECYNILDLREIARRRLPGPIFHSLEGGAETEETLRRNTSAFDADRLIPKCLVDVSRVSTATRILGQEIGWPVFCSPTGGSRIFHPDGEFAVARACAKADTLYSLSTMATCSLEELAEAGDGPKMFQLYVFKNRDFSYALIERARQAGYHALSSPPSRCVRAGCCNRCPRVRCRFPISRRPTAGPWWRRPGSWRRSRMRRCPGRTRGR